MAKSCTEKRKFETYIEAKAFADGYDNRVALTFHPIAPYWCERHDSWHIGHNKYQQKFYPPHSI